MELSVSAKDSWPPGLPARLAILAACSACVLAKAAGPAGSTCLAGPESREQDEEDDEEEREEEEPGSHIRRQAGWLAEQGSPEHFSSLFLWAAITTMELEAAVDVALRLGQAKGWWEAVQPGLQAAFDAERNTHDMHAVLAQLQRVRRSTDLDGVQRYVQLATAVHRRPAKQQHAAGCSEEFVRDLLLAIYVPGCPESAQLLGRAAAHLCRCPQRYPPETLLLPALEGFAQQRQLGSLAAAVQAAPALQVLVQQVADVLQARAPPPPALPEDWSLPEAALRIRCVKRNCADCAAVRAFLESAQQAELRMEMEGKRRGHFTSIMGSVKKLKKRMAGTPGFTWRDDGAAIVLSKRGDYDAALAEYNRKHSGWQQLLAALGGGDARPGGSGNGAVPPPPPPPSLQQHQKQQSTPQPPLQQQQGESDDMDLSENSPPAKKQRL
ncbi:hypothetical protein C2E21_8622 [Chlorella sorokiniana]|uniref:Uncharacterized protein n=1 Tax=Chlorella sorokiniana TaxID=3076 RepID=A0A2P6TDX8_CHLSO|nr:hypothetical protein C2E21_8622 [Chlorella sorokiniana]|eukprot:PRW20856.1 hypothetical protein C2E21_8622 [Chlorella sorokiniana]